MNAPVCRREVPPYTRLAEIYDEVMAHVDYEGWARYIAALIDRHHPRAERVLELGCGTGSLAYRLQSMGGFEYHATDISPQMIEIARKKPDSAVADVSFAVRDFRELHDHEPVDVVLLLYDGLNYLLDKRDIPRLLNVMSEALRPGGIAIFDQSTPANSLENQDDFDDQGEGYQRRSSYDLESNIHTTVLEIDAGGVTEVETHRQRAYEMDVIEKYIGESDFTLIEALEDCTHDQATAASYRVHWVVRKPA